MPRFNPWWAGPALLGALAAVAAVLLRRRRAASHPQQASWRCACGQRFTVSGLGRHRVYWLDGAAENDPVLDHACPSCERPLPADSGNANGAQRSTLVS